jgi:hypothetical protein
MSSPDIESGFPTVEVTAPATVTTDGTGAAAFTIEMGARTELFLQAVEQ